MGPGRDLLRSGNFFNLPVNPVMLLILGGFARYIRTMNLKSAGIVLSMLVLNGCVASVKEISLDKALIQVVDRMDALRKRQQELAKVPKYRYLGTCVKDVKVVFNVSVAGDVSTKAEGSGCYGPVKGDLVVTTDYKSSRANQLRST